MSKISKQKSPASSKEISPNITTSNDLNDKFEFYSRIVKLNILRKDNTEVISKYSTWLDALRKHSDAKVRYDYVKLLLMGLDHTEPTSMCPFNDYPPVTIDPLEIDDWTTAARNLFFNVQQNTDPACQQPIALNPPVVTAVSDDRRQFAAYQTIPNVGLQVFYAQSDEPLYKWFFKQGSPSKQPDSASQAKSLDWERSLAGIRKDPNHKKIYQDSSSAKITKSDDTSDPCVILETDQENLNRDVGVFKWNNKSLLTGDTIPGSEFCVDWMIHEHEKTQLEIDEEMVRLFDKLYPDNFRLSASPELLEGIVDRMQGIEKNTVECQNQIEATTCSQPTRQYAGNDQELARFLRSKKIFSIEDMWMEEKYKDWSTEVSVLDINQFNKYETKSFDIPDGQNPETPEPIFKPLSDDENKCTSEFSSFEKAAKSFYTVASKAEDTMKEVNEWFNNKQRKNY